MFSSVSGRLDFVVFTETWLCNDNVDLFHIVGYLCHVNVPRSGEKGGGIAIYAKECWNTKAIQYRVLLASAQVMFLCWIISCQ